MKTKKIIKVISSTGEPHDVYFEFSDNKLTVFCNCPAGVYRKKICKHKTRLLDGDSSMLVNKTDQNLLDEVHAWVKKSKYSDIISSYNALKKEIEELQKKEKKLREKIESALKTGIEIV